MQTRGVDWRRRTQAPPVAETGVGIDAPGEAVEPLVSWGVSCVYGSVYFPPRAIVRSAGSPPRAPVPKRCMYYVRKEGVHASGAPDSC